jgi:hypothetical protein
MLLHAGQGSFIQMVKAKYPKRRVAYNSSVRDVSKCESVIRYRTQAVPVELVTPFFP